jgi:hypothetical protein
MPDDVGAIFARLGLSVNDFEAGMKKASDLARSQTSLMSAEMKRQSREGAESLRLIDEAIGVHISRPLTRVIAQIPGVGAALQSVFALSAGGAFGAVAFEGIEKLNKAIEESHTKIFAMSEAWTDVRKTFDASMESSSKAIATLEERLATLTSGKVAGLEVALKNVDTQALKAAGDIDKTFEAMSKAQKASQGHWYDPAIAMGSKIKDAVTPESTLEVRQLEDHFRSLKASIDDAFLSDAENKTHQALQLINKDLDEEQDKLLGIQNLAKVGAASRDAAWQQQLIVDFLARAKDQATAAQTQDNLTGQVSGKELDLAKIEEFQKETKVWNEASNEGWKKWAEINKEIEKAIANVGGELFAETEKWTKAMQKQFAPYFPTYRPSLPPGTSQSSSDMLELQKITVDRNEAEKEAARIATELETPEQKLAIAEATLKELRQQGLISIEQETAGMQKANEAYTQQELHLEKLQQQLIKLLERTNSATAGFQAFLLQTAIQGSQGGKFVFDELNKGIQGVEDGIAKLAVTGRANFGKLLEGMTEDLVKFAEQQTLKLLLGMLGNSDFFGALGGGMLFGSGGAFGGGRAGGGDVMPGTTYLVGENGPEYLTMGRNMGAISPNGGGGGDTHIHNYDLRGASVEAVERLQRMLPEVENRAAYRGYLLSIEAGKRTTK